MLKSEYESLDEDASVHLKWNELYPLIDLKYPEEFEHCLFKSPAKLYRYVDSEWRDHGPGLISILETSSPKRWRILMRRDGTLKVCLNHYIIFQMKLMSRGDSGRCFCWMTPNEFSDGISKREILAVKFRTFEAANSFKRTFDDCVNFTKDAQKVLKDRSSDSKLTDKPISPSVGSKMSAKSVKENKEKVDLCMKEDLTGKAGKVEDVPRKEKRLSGENTETKVLSDTLANVKLNSLDEQ